MIMTGGAAVMTGIRLGPTGPDTEMSAEIPAVAEHKTTEKAATFSSTQTNDETSLNTTSLL